jgi:uncharacterized repeat protein (TIGR03803 family)
MEVNVGHRRFSHHLISGLALLAVFAMLVDAAWAGASTTKVAYSFAGDEDGEYPATDLVRDSEGYLYGTTVQGGEFGGGTVFQLSPSGVHTVLYSFTGGADGGQPYGGVTLDGQGDLYGAAVIGGTGGTCVEDGCGVIYKLTNSGGTWSQRVIHNFTGGKDGSGPGAGLTLDEHGNLYGMTPTGGAYGLGVIYQMRPGQGGVWKLRVIHAFTGGLDGGTASAGRLLLDDAGNLFGVATVFGANGKGTAFKLTRRPNGTWKMRTIYAFKGHPDAGLPYGALISDDSGNLFGTTYWEGEHNLGSVYELSFRNGTWKERVLYSFRGGADGASPISNLVFDQVGNLYGTTSEGGAPGCSCGTIFKLSPGQFGQWTETVAHAFTNAPDGAFPYNGMVADQSGNFYGTTVHGGDDGEGAIYEFTP